MDKGAQCRELEEESRQWRAVTSLWIKQPITQPLFPHHLILGPLRPLQCRHLCSYCPTVEFATRNISALWSSTVWPSTIWAHPLSFPHICPLLIFQFQVINFSHVLPVNPQSSSCFPTPCRGRLDGPSGSQLFQISTTNGPLPVLFNSSCLEMFPLCVFPEKSSYK